MNTTNLTFRTNLLLRPLVNSFVKTKDIISFNKIVHFQYMQLLENNNSESDEESSEDRITAKQFINIVVNRLINQLSSNNSDVLIQVKFFFFIINIFLFIETIFNHK